MADNEEFKDDEEIETDIIDVAIGQMVDEFLGDDTDDDEFDEISDVVFDVVADLVDNGEIEDIPAEDAPDEEKQAWLDKYMGTLKQKVREEIDGDSDLE